MLSFTLTSSFSRMLQALSSLLPSFLGTNTNVSASNNNPDGDSKDGQSNDPNSLNNNNMDAGAAATATGKNNISGATKTRRAHFYTRPSWISCTVRLTTSILFNPKTINRSRYPIFRNVTRRRWQLFKMF